MADSSNLSSSIGGAASAITASSAASHIAPTSSTNAPWSTLYRDALLIVDSFLAFKELPSVLAVCRNWLALSKHERCRSVSDSFQDIRKSEFHVFWQAVEWGCNGIFLLQSSAASTVAVPSPDCTRCQRGRDRHRTAASEHDHHASAAIVVRSHCSTCGGGGGGPPGRIICDEHQREHSRSIVGLGSR
jgi:hypothetical protein